MKRTRLNRKGSNQHRVKSRDTWKFWTLGYILAVLLIIVFAQHFKDEGMKKAYAEMPVISPLGTSIAGEIAKPTFKDQRVGKLYDFLLSKRSPLTEHSQFIVDLSDKHDLPYTLIASIAGKESSFGINIKENSHNAWGIMQWDAEGNRSIRSFKSWEDAITFEASLLDKSFRKDMASGIQRRYCPSEECSDTWAEDVATFAANINN